MAESPERHVTRLLKEVGASGKGVDELLEIVYRELRAIAGRLMDRERDDHTLQPTALVHEAFVRLVQGQDGQDLGDSRRSFLAIASRAMRNLLVDHARRHGAVKRGGAQDWNRVTLAGLAEEANSDHFDLIALHEALEELERIDERQARIVEMCFFAGMTGKEIAEELGVHRNTVTTELRMARAWLLRHMRDE